uniref:Uncharacterized protein n=1 Tax=Salix viminalis TaxID=40686 RepID=A0A6N2N2Q6_SALVM
MSPKLSVEFLWRLSLTILLVSVITSSSTAAFLKRNSSPIFNATVGEDGAAKRGLLWLTAANVVAEEEDEETRADGAALVADRKEKRPK